MTGEEENELCDRYNPQKEDWDEQWFAGLPYSECIVCEYGKCDKDTHLRKDDIPHIVIVGDKNCAGQQNESAWNQETECGKMLGEGAVFIHKWKHNEKAKAAKIVEHFSRVREKIVKV